MLQQGHESSTRAIPHQYSSFNLPSTSGDSNSTFKDDLDDCRAAISLETTSGNDVILIVHSYDGMVSNSAIRDLTLSVPG
jgi:hypothetical protein